MQQTGESATSPSSYASWAGAVEELCELFESLRPLAAALGMPDPTPTDWHGALFGKLRGEVSRGPFVVAAVCGGTNTGKSLIANTLAGAEISASVPEAARTRHPVASLPRLGRQHRPRRGLSRLRATAVGER